LCMFWLWSIDNAPNGDLEGIDIVDIADAAGWAKEPESFIDAMREAGFVDGYMIHDWDAYIGRLIERLEHQREINREKQRRYRERKRNAESNEGDNGAVTNHEITGDVTGYSEVTDRENEGGIAESVYDPEWARVAKAYEANIGLLPVGVALERLVSFYEDVGGDVMCYAIEYTNLKHPRNPKQFLDKVLNNWVERGIKTLEAAKAYTIDFQRNIEQEKNARHEGAKGAGGSDKESPVIDGKFY
jgi:DnaD/phage-associated family protein